MILIGLSLALLVIVAGMFLLAKTKKDDLGSVFRFTSYFTITIGVLFVIGGICGGLCKMANHIGGGYDKAACHQSIGQSKCLSGGPGCGLAQGYGGKKCFSEGHGYGSGRGYGGHSGCEKGKKECVSKYSSHSKKSCKKPNCCKKGGKKKIIKEQDTKKEAAAE